MEPKIQELGVVRVPHRFEALAKIVGRERLSQVLLESREDLDAIKRALADVGSAGQGKLLFLFGPSGVGKTSLAESAGVFISDQVGEVVTPPGDYEVTLADLPGWLATKLADARRKAGSRILLLNLDGREIPAADSAATRAAMVNLNTYLRRQTQTLVTWPIVNREFAEEAIGTLQVAGAQTALARSPIHEVRGLAKERYFDALRLILDSTGVRLSDAAVSDDEARGFVDAAETIGSYLESIHQLVVERFDLGQLGATLPRLFIAVAGGDGINEACRQLRRGSQYLVDPDRLLQFSRANVADDWRQRGRENARRGLPFIASLLEVRLVSVTMSAVVNSVAFSPDSELQAAVRRKYPTPVSSNAANSLRNGGLARALQGQEDTAAAGGQTTKPIRGAYAAIQGMSKKKHRAINEAIVGVLRQDLEIDFGNERFEYHPFNDRELRCDLYFERTDRPESLEFTYRAEDKSSSSVIASYVLEKVQDYARDYRLI